MSRSGGCLCGAVRFTATELGDCGVCHCKMCQRWAGSAMFAVTVPEAAMRITGADNVATLATSDWARRSWCTKCGSSLWYRHDPGQTGGGAYEVVLGLLDDAGGLRIRHEIFIDCKPDSFALVGDHPRLTEADVAHRFAGSQR